MTAMCVDAPPKSVPRTVCPQHATPLYNVMLYAYYIAKVYLFLKGLCCFRYIMLYAYYIANLFIFERFMLFSLNYFCWLSFSENKTFK